MNVSTHKEIIQESRHFRDIVLQRWVAETFLHWRWWLLIILTILPWLIFWKVIDKKRIHEIFLYGFLNIILIVILDALGSFMVWWDYPVNLFPSPPLLPPDLSIVPCLMMYVYQSYRSWKSFIVANLLLSAIMAFIGEPLFIWLNFYRLNEWHLFYSFCFYNIIGVFSRWFVHKTMAKNKF